MIVADTNVIAYLYLPTERQGQARAALRTDHEWLAPPLWRSEMRNALALYIWQGELKLAVAVAIMDQAEALMAEGERDVRSADVLALAAASGCAAYDCEFVALAQMFDIPLVTVDKKVLRTFPDTALALDKFVGP